LSPPLLFFSRFSIFYIIKPTFYDLVAAIFDGFVKSASVPLREEPLPFPPRRLLFCPDMGPLGYRGYLLFADPIGKSFNFGGIAWNGKVRGPRSEKPAMSPIG
jgi:hypothetical protein